MFVIDKSDQPRIVPEKYNVLWQDYNDHLRDMLHTMRKFDEFTDVTLICDDQREIHAHKVVLSACSPVLKTILQRKDYGIPIVYLKGIQFPEMESILQFMYLGQTTVEQQRITSFLDVAKNLEIKELSENIKVQKPATTGTTTIRPSGKLPIRNVHLSPKREQLPVNPVTASQLNFTTSQAPQSISIPNAQRLRAVDPIKSSQQVKLPSQRVDKSLSKIIQKVKFNSSGFRETKEEFAKCGICHEVFKNAKVFMQHYKDAHTEASEAKSELEDNPDDPAEYFDDEPGTEISQPMLEDKTNCGSLSETDSEITSGISGTTQPKTAAFNNIPPPELVFECQKCGFNSTSREELKAHKLSEHPKKPIMKKTILPGKNYACFMCQYKSTDKTTLTDHIANEHSEEIGNLVNPLNG